MSIKRLLPASLVSFAVLASPAWSADLLFAKADVTMSALSQQEQKHVQQFYNEYQNVRIDSGLSVNQGAWNQNAFDVNLPDGQRITLKASKRYVSETAAEVVVASSSDLVNARSRRQLTSGDSVLVNNNGLITASIRHQGKLYSVRSLESGQHLVMEVDESRMPVDHPEHEYAAILENAVESRLNEMQPSGVSIAANTVITLLVNYTPSAKNAVSNINGLIDLAVAETNTGYSNSAVGITVQVAHRAQVNYTESSSMTTDRDRYASTSDGYMDEIHTQRNTYKADVGVLILNNSSSCGIAKAIGASATTAFAVVHHSCATGYYSFAHEIGHLQSARHDPAADPSTTPYAYGHGYRAPNNKWRTIMAYNCSPSCPRLNYWSNPNKTYSDGQKMGTTTKSDNARVLNNTKAKIAGFR